MSAVSRQADQTTWKETTHRFNAKLRGFQTKILVFDTEFLVFSTKFLVFDT